MDLNSVMLQLVLVWFVGGCMVSIVNIKNVIEKKPYP